MGLEKLATTESSVADMQQELIALQPQLEVSTKETEAAMVVSSPATKCILPTGGNATALLLDQYSTMQISCLVSCIHWIHGQAMVYTLQMKLCTQGAGPTVQPEGLRDPACAPNNGACDAGALNMHSGMHCVCR